MSVGILGATLAGNLLLMGRRCVRRSGPELVSWRAERSAPNSTAAGDRVHSERPGADSFIFRSGTACFGGVHKRPDPTNHGLLITEWSPGDLGNVVC